MTIGVGKVAALALLTAVFATGTATAAKADSFLSVSYGESYGGRSGHGDWHGRPHRDGPIHGGYAHHGFWREDYRFYGHPHFQPRRVIYTSPTVVYVNPPPVVQRQVVYQPVAPVMAEDVSYESSGAYCREYTSTVRVAGKLQQGFGTACMQPDGTWKRVK